MKKFESYLPILHALKALMKRALDLKVKKETPEGTTRTFKISGIRIAYMRQQSYVMPYLNAPPGYIEVHKPAPELLITLFYDGKRKKVSCPVSIKSTYLQTYYGILSSGWPRISTAISELIDEFHGSKLSDQKYYKEYHVEKPPHMSDEEFNLPPLESIPKDFVKGFEEFLRNMFLTECIAQINAKVSSNRKVWIVIDSWGTQIIQKQDIMQVGIEPYAINDKKCVYACSISRMAKSFDNLKEELPKFKQEFQEFLNSINRKQLPSGIYPLIFAPSATATLFHEAIVGHMLSGAYIVDNESTIFKGKLGKSVCTENYMSILKKLWIWDRPLANDMIATYKYDMEGVPAKDVLLISKGILKDYLYNRNSAARLKKEDNGHALAESFQSKSFWSLFGSYDDAQLPEPRVSNLVISTDSKTKFKDLEEAYFKKYGYYILVKSEEGQVDITTGTFKLGVDHLEKVYPDGKREYFHGGIFSANLTDFISAIQEVSNEYGNTYGYCGAESGYVPTQEYTPAMSVHGINWAPIALPEPQIDFEIKRDKYISKKWVKSESYEFPTNKKDEK